MFSTLKHYYRSLRYPCKKNICGKANEIIYSDSILKSVTFDIVGDNNTIVIGKSCSINSLIFYVRGNNHSVYIGESCVFQKGGEIWIEDSDCRLEIGKRSTFEEIHLAITEPKSSVTIGEDCMFAYDIDVRTGDSHSIVDLESQKRINFAKNICIGDHVWVAAHCSILKGVCIPDNSVVGTGSIVTHQFSKNGVVIAGNPAKIVKSGITWFREKIYRA